MPFVKVDFMHVVLYEGDSEWIGAVCSMLERECWITVCCVVPVRDVSVDQC